MSSTPRSKALAARGPAARPSRPLRMRVTAESGQIGAGGAMVPQGVEYDSAKIKVGPQARWFALAITPPTHIATHKLHRFVHNPDPSCHCIRLPAIQTTCQANTPLCLQLR